MSKPSSFSIRGRRALVAIKDERDLSIVRRQFDRLGVEIFLWDPDSAPTCESDVILLGTLQAHQNRPIRVGEELVVVGWTIDAGQRSTRTASAIIGRGGEVVASARAVWVAMRR